MLVERSPLKEVLSKIFVPAAVVAACMAAIGETPRPATDKEASAAAAAFSSAGTLRFAQISDAHLFDAGYKCSGLYVEREYQENLAALRWSIDEVNRRWRSGDRIDFLVFTGDMGITNLAGLKAERKKGDSPCFSPSDSEESWGPIRQWDFAPAETLIAKLIDCLPGKVPVYFLPGNNDVEDENSTDLDRYARFVGGLGKLTHGHEVVDLNGQSKREGRYTLVGLNSTGFKPQKEETVTKGSGAGSYCNELVDAENLGRGKAKADAIKDFVNLVQDEQPYLVFTHIPDLQDPYRLKPDDPSFDCQYRSAWLLTERGRNDWMASGLDNPFVVGVFAGHFHDPDLSHYGGPLYSGAVRTLYLAKPGQTFARPGGLAQQFVTPPLAEKLQWKAYPYGARGMMFVSVVNGVVNAQIDPYWTALSPDCCGDAPTSWQRSLLKMLRDHPDYSFLIAFMFTLVLVIAVLLLAGELDPTCKPASAAPNWLLRYVSNRFSCVKHTALKVLIDGQTNTYSLSKMQFVLWTLASIYGYAYLCVAHSWVQGLPGLPDIADQFPFEQSFSGATAIVTQYFQRTRGTKGGGPLKPQLSDLISAGGVIAPGRLQFFSWTLAAIAAYVGSILASDPCTAYELPTIPHNLLIISGLSSIAYLGARLAAAPGPVIGSASYVPVPPVPGGAGAGGSMAGGGGTSPGGGAQAGAPPLDALAAVLIAAGKLIIIGSGLSKLATIVLVHESEIVPAAIALLPADGSSTSTENTAPPLNLETTLDMSKSDVQLAPAPYIIDPKYAVAGFPDYGTKLEVEVVKGLDPTKTYRIRVTNPDGKYGEGVLNAEK